MGTMAGKTALLRAAGRIAFILTLSAHIAQSENLMVGSPNLLYDANQLGFYLDGSFATLKNPTNPNELFFFTSTNGFENGTDLFRKYAGTPTAPLGRLIYTKTQGSFFYNGAPAYLWLSNIHKLPDGSLLGFLHMEGPVLQMDPLKRNYSIGLAWSSHADYGDKWYYCGEIVRPQTNNVNLHGVPYLVVGDYFHVYFKEQVPTGGTKRWAVARAKVADVVAAASGPSHSVTPWKKYSNGTWNQDGLTGLGSDILPATNDGKWLSDIHSDAAYNSVLRKYMITINLRASENTLCSLSVTNFLCLYTSTDGVNWTNSAVVNQCHGDWSNQYSCFAATTGASDDCGSVGMNFTIIYPHKSVEPPNVDILYYRNLSVGNINPILRLVRN